VLSETATAANAQHLAAEFLSRYQVESRSLPVVALTTDNLGADSDGKRLRLAITKRNP
jgi:phosphoheptose isomerase